MIVCSNFDWIRSTCAIKLDKTIALVLLITIDGGVKKFKLRPEMDSGLLIPALVAKPCIFSLSFVQRWTLESEERHDLDVPIWDSWCSYYGYMMMHVKWWLFLGWIFSSPSNDTILYEWSIIATAFLHREKLLKSVFKLESTIIMG